MNWLIVVVNQCVTVFFLYLFDEWQIALCWSKGCHSKKSSKRNHHRCTTFCKLPIVSVYVNTTNNNMINEGLEVVSHFKGGGFNLGALKKTREQRALSWQVEGHIIYKETNSVLLSCIFPLTVLYMRKTISATEKQMRPIYVIRKKHWRCEIQ